MSNEDDVFLSEWTHWRYRHWYSSSFLSRYEYSNDLTISNNILAKCKILGRVAWRHIELFCIVNWSVDIELRRHKIVHLYRNICRSRPSCNESLSITRHLRSVSVSIWDTLRIPRSASNPIAFVSSDVRFLHDTMTEIRDVKDTCRRVRLSTCVRWQTRECLPTCSSWIWIWLRGTELTHVDSKRTLSNCLRSTDVQLTIDVKNTSSRVELRKRLYVETNYIDVQSTRRRAELI